MTSARTVAVFGVYLLLVGVGLLGAPDAIVRPLGFPPVQDFWPRVVGVLTLALGTYYLIAARGNNTAFFRASVLLRFAVFGIFGAFTLVGLAPKPLALLGCIDLAGALWTAFALKAERSAN
jgi:uncharacterized membrane protein HdeD (DUF308 family)